MNMSVSEVSSHFCCIECLPGSLPGRAPLCCIECLPGNNPWEAPFTCVRDNWVAYAACAATTDGADASAREPFPPSFHCQYTGTQILPEPTAVSASEATILSGANGVEICAGVDAKIGNFLHYLAHFWVGSFLGIFFSVPTA